LDDSTDTDEVKPASSESADIASIIKNTLSVELEKQFVCINFFSLYLCFFMPFCFYLNILEKAENIISRWWKVERNWIHLSVKWWSVLFGFRREIGRWNFLETDGKI
jgi:hypothetical protein